MSFNMAGPRSGTCIICSNPLASEINADLLTSGTPLILAAKKWHVSENTMHRHTKRCLGRTAYQIQAAPTITNAADVEKRYQYALNEAQNIYLAAKRLLEVDGDLCLDPRSWEISIIYVDYNDVDPITNMPRLKSDSLDNILATLASEGMVVKHSFIKSEDMRKGLREAFNSFVSVIDRFGKLFGVFQKDKPNEQGELEDIRRAITRASLKLGTSYAYELNKFLQDEGDRVRGDLRGMLEKESQSLSGALPAGVGGGGSPLQLPPQNPATHKTREEHPHPSDSYPEHKKNSGEILPRRPVSGIKCDCGLVHDGTTDDLLLEWTCDVTGELKRDVDE